MKKKKKKKKKKKNGDRDGKELYKFMGNAVYEKTKKNLRKRIDVKLVSNKKGYLKWRYGLYVTQNIWQWLSCDM